MVVERGGKSILAGLKANPSANDPCPFKSQCLADTENDCTKSNCVYQIVCQLCQSPDDTSGSASQVSTPGQSEADEDQSQAQPRDKPTHKPARRVGKVRMAPAKTHYIGTSARSQHARSRDHQKDLMGGNKKNALVKHMQIEHSSAQPEFVMHKLGSYKYNLHRQIFEGLCIEQASESKSTHLLNSRTEWGRAKLPRLVIANSQG